MASQMVSLFMTVRVMASQMVSLFMTVRVNAFEHDTALFFHGFIIDSSVSILAKEQDDVRMEKVEGRYVFTSAPTKTSMTESSTNYNRRHMMH